METQNDEIDNVPLTKSKGKREQIQPPAPEAIKPMQEKKPRPPKSEKQLESMKRALEVRRANIEKRRYEKKLEASKFLVEHDIKQMESIIKPKQKKIVELSSEDDDSESDTEIVYIKKPRKVKKNKIVVEVSESESESEEEPRHKQFGKSHQNKKSIVKMQDKPKQHQEQSKLSYRKMFTD